MYVYIILAEVCYLYSVTKNYRNAVRPRRSCTLFLSGLVFMVSDVSSMGNSSSLLQNFIGDCMLLFML